MLYSIAEHLASALDAVLIMVFLGQMNGRQRNRRVLTCLFVILEYICAQFVSNMLLQMLFNIIILMLYSLLCLQGKRMRLCVWSVAATIIYAAISAVILPLLSIAVDRPIEDMVQFGTIVRVYSLIICKIFQCLVLFIIYMFSKKDIVLRRSESIVIILMFLINFLVIAEIFEINLEVKVYGRQQLKWLIITVVVVLMLVVCIFMVIRTSYLNRLSLESNLLRQQIDNQKDMIEKAYSVQKETRLMRHDMKHYVSLWEYQLEQNACNQVRQEMQKYLNRMDIVNTNIQFIINNDLINAVLYEKNELCKKDNIKCEMQISTSFSKEMETNIAILLSNLFDNAILAELNVEKEHRLIHIKVFDYNDCKNIIIENYIVESVLEKNPTLSTTKENKVKHGLGITNVKRIVKEHDGIINIIEEGELFVVHIQIN